MGECGLVEIGGKDCLNACQNAVEKNQQSDWHSGRLCSQVSAVKLTLLFSFLEEQAAKHINGSLINVL